nr:class I SAM-dependent methyltransferase [Candidatus Freyarchaeota archaeon]
MHILLKESVTESDLQTLYTHEIEVLFSNKKTWNCYRYQERYAKVVELVKRYVPKKSKIIDIGSSHGNFSLGLASEGYIMLGLELEPNFVKYARWKLKKKKPGVMDNVNFVVGTSSNLPVPSDAFDCVLLLETIEHLKEPEKALQEIRRVLRKNGFLVLSTVKRFSFIHNSRSFKEFREKYQKGEELTDSHFGDEHLFELNEEESIDLFSSCGLDVLRLDTIAPLILYPILSIKGLNSLPNPLTKFLVKVLSKLNLLCRGIVIVAKKHSI